MSVGTRAGPIADGGICSALVTIGYIYSSNQSCSLTLWFVAIGKGHRVVTHVEDVSTQRG